MSSTSEYHESEHSMMEEDTPHPDTDLDSNLQPQWGRSLRGRKVKKNNYRESASEDDLAPALNGKRIVRRQTSRPPIPADPPRRMTRARSRAIAKSDEGYVDEPSDNSDEGSIDDAPHTSDLDADADAEGEPDFDGEGEPGLEAQDDGRPYGLRQRVRINYAIPPPIEETKPSRPTNRGGARHKRGPGWSATGAELSRWMGMPPDDSDSDIPTRTPRKGFSALMGAGALGAGSTGLLPGELATVAGTPSNFGKIGDSALADADPLGVNQNITFDEVGGLDEHIQSLKEMTVLPLLYPEVFQRFNLTPPRGVLFHGPPGTGKTLLARALAASCRANGKGISFFMRKGADCLSKWVGEAERQLRLLFDEARNCQPSIIFFDEIDGLAPVRSSKQDQIHASIVSTLLALMDGMDGRGQVIVIGATNRPDAIDPALRRPGRFDREFYFPLPSLEAREKILGIITKLWDGWSGEPGKENVKSLAKLTKGYAGADLRALCTEAALNAIQRRYPQIYQSNDRLLLKPETIGVTLRDFMISVKNLVPSSARSSSSAASPLPPQLEPLLGSTSQKVRDAIHKVLPASKKRTALEEAQWEDSSEESALEREMLMQSMETLRVYRPRLIVHGPPGMGQGYVGAAALHHLEGYHIQCLDLATLMGDSTRTSEAAIVQLFVEAKRHQPSVIYIPSLLSWCAAVHETARITIRSMLDSLAPTDPILLLAIVDGSYTSLPSDVRSWFGMTRDNRLLLHTPNEEERRAFFASIISDIRRPPNQFADGLKRKRRVLEELPIAPPPEPRQPTAVELAAQEESDHRFITLLKYRLGPVLTELKRKFKRFTKRATEEYEFELNIYGVTEVEKVGDAVPEEVQPQPVNGTEAEVQTAQLPVLQPQDQAQLQLQPQNHSYDMDLERMQIHTAQLPVLQPQPQAQLQLQPQNRLYDMDLERMHMDLYKGKYLTPQDFLDDIHKIVHNAAMRMHEDLERLHKAQAMLTAAEVSMQEFDLQFRLECQRMAERERKRREERRKAKGKGKSCTPEGSQNGTYAPSRRSTRHSGQPLAITITDPLQLERRLKRARSDRVGGSEDSSEENKFEDVGTRPQPKKRLRTIVSDDDEMDLIGPTASQSKTPTVRFADSGEPSRPNGATVPPPSDGDPLPVIHTPREPTRSPSPLPDLHVDEGLLFNLEHELRVKTSQLSVEQLEQLRASCLNNIWNHRAEWNRDALVRELLGLLDEFLEDCLAGSGHDCEPMSPLDVACQL